MTETQQAVLNWLANGETGLSSETLAFWVAFDVQKYGLNHPHDPPDFNRCLGLLKAAPAMRTQLHKMSSVSPTWAALVKHWDQIESTLVAEVGLDWEKGRWTPARKTYDLMQSVINA